MVTTQGLRMKNPTYPGGFVRSEIIEALGLLATDAAHVMGVTRPALSALPNERAQLSPEMALRIEKAFGVSMDTLMRMQNSYDIAQARKRKTKSTSRRSMASRTIRSNRYYKRFQGRKGQFQHGAGKSVERIDIPASTGIRAAPGCRRGSAVFQ